MTITQTDESESSAKRAKRSEIKLGRAEVMRRLREMRRPITLFGESDEERYHRLKELQLQAHDKQTSSSGTGNLIHDVLQQEVAAEILKAAEETMEKERTGGAGGGDDKKSNGRRNKYANDRDMDDFESEAAYVLYFLKRMLYMWQHDLDSRPDAIKRSNKGKLETTKHKTIRHNIRPLFKSLKSGKADKDIVRHLRNIADCCRQREYVKANEAYYLMSIGNAAWPIGVTMVGIHERSGREKIFAANVTPHMLNNNETRKYIQAVKRLMSYCQEQYPNVPSKNAG
jgi:pre-mRNA-splicing factor 18